MSTLTTAISLAGLLVLGTLVPSRAATMSCVTINGETHCDSAGQSLVCQTVNGRTTCLRGSGTLSCRTMNGDTACEATPEEPDEIAEDQDEPDEPQRDSTVRPDDLQVWRDKDGLHVRAGGTVIDLE